jgi:membrane-associated phospholipid phosphatase
MLEELAMQTEEVRHRMFERRLHALIAGIVLLATALVLGVIVALDPAGSAVQGLDDRWLGWMVDLRTPWLTRLAKDVSTIGSVKVTMPLRILVSAALIWHRRWLQFGAFVGAVITSELCIGPLKALVDRPRPPDPLIGTSAASFPSGHAIAGAVTAFGLVVVLWPASPRRWLAIGFAAAFAGIMAISRTYLAAHWLTDTIAGACIGTGLALVWPAALEMARERHSRRNFGATSAFSSEPVLPRSVLPNSVLPKSVSEDRL